MIGVGGVILILGLCILHWAFFGDDERGGIISEMWKDRKAAKKDKK